MPPPRGSAGLPTAPQGSWGALGNPREPYGTPGKPREPWGTPGKHLIFLRVGRNQVLERFLDDLEAGIGISIKKKLLDMGSNIFFDGFEVFRIFTSMCLFLGF